ncbi:transposase [Nonomuraea sp. NPDC050153]|uniref:IS1634 family transposase n=1 Tax=Nonomuraea sp. NPDC050153 TaxID=3364359 RepID=UPI0037900087
MYLRSTPRRNKDGSVVRYLQLAHNEWDQASKRSKVQVIYNFGREEKASSREALVRLVASAIKFLDPAQILAVAADGLEFVESRPLGGAWVLDGLWRQLGIDATLRRMCREGGLDAATERVVFALVAKQALAPGHGPPPAAWVNDDVLVDGLPATDDDACERALEWLVEIYGRLEEEVLHRVVDCHDLKVDLVLFDASCACGCARHVPPSGTPGPHDDGRLTGMACFGTAVDDREDPHDVVIGMAATRTGIPLRMWCWPSCADDSAMVRQAKDDLNGWTLSRVIRTAERGCATAYDLRDLRTDDDLHYIIGERLRPGSVEADAALSRQGRYQRVAPHLRVKEVRIAGDERFVVYCDAEAAERDARARARLVERLAELIADTDRLPPAARAELCTLISAQPGMNRYLRLTPGGLLRIDAKAVKAEENLDGKCLVRTSDPELSAEEIALGYTQLLNFDRGWHDLLTDLRPVRARGEAAVHGDLLLRWAALVLVRVAESRTGMEWARLRYELDRIKLGVFASKAGTLLLRTELTDAQQDLFAALSLAPPPRVFPLTP